MCNFAILHQITREIMLLLVNNVHEKTPWKVKTDNVHEKTPWKVKTDDILKTCYNYALTLYENALLLSQSEAHKFFMYIIAGATHYMDTGRT